VAMPGAAPGAAPLTLATPPAQIPIA